MKNDNMDRTINQYNSDFEERMTALRQIHDTLSHNKRTLLEKVLKKLIVCTNLFGEILPSARMNIFVLDFDTYRQTNVEERPPLPGELPPEVLTLFNGPNIPMFLLDAYLAVRKWNRGLFYAPKHPALRHESRHHPVPPDLPKDPGLRLAKLVRMANEPLPLEEHSEDPAANGGNSVA